jgi:hypothetical protein
MHLKILIYLILELIKLIFWTLYIKKIEHEVKNDAWVADIKKIQAGHMLLSFFLR